MCKKSSLRNCKGLVMIPMIPDCGVLSTPRRTSSLNLCENGLKISPVPAKTALTSQKAYKLAFASPVSSEMSGVTLSSGFSFGFYKSPKNTVSPYRKIEPLPSHKHIKRPREGINKGVGHKIKKPKQKTKEKIKSRQNVKTVVKRLKEGKYTPCLPSNRSPKKSPSPGEKKKQRVLSSPGMSLLETEQPTIHFVPESKNGRFFTSRSRAAATVHIGKNIMLAAKYGDLSLKQREGTFTKKNVGRRIEDELHQYLKKSDEYQSMEKVLSLPSVQANPRPIPTRVPSSPSPGKSSVKHRKSRTPSPQKYKTKTGLHNKSNVSGCSTEEELLDMESLLEEWDVCERKETSAAEKFSSDKTLDSETIKSTRELGCAASPSRKTLMKFRQSDSPTRKSPRKLGKIDSPTRKSPRKLEEKASLKKLGQSCIPTRTSPRKVANGSSQGEFQTNENVSPSRNPSTQGSLKSSEKMKVFSIFDPHRRHVDQKIPLSKTRNRQNNRRQTVDDDSTQMMMDAGQKKFGAQQCSMCGVVYEVGSLSDETSHSDYHDRFLNSLKFLGWKKEKLARDLDYLGGRVIMISSEDPPHCWRKVEEILEIVDTELGFSENGIHTKENTKAFVYVLERKIVGCLIAERLSKAYKVIPQESATQGNGRVMCCSKTPTKVWAGISRLWVLPSERGKGIASTLVDAMKDNMIRNYFLSMDDIAFSDPTENGMGFAEAYTGKRDFFVYRRELI